MALQEDATAAFAVTVERGSSLGTHLDGKPPGMTMQADAHLGTGMQSASVRTLPERRC